MSTKEIFQGHIFSVIQKQMDVNGQLLWRDIVIHPGGAAICAVLNDQILLVKQSRAALNGQETLEIPAGTLDPGEAPDQTALRELNEETGYTADHLSLISAFWPTPGYDTEVIYVYYAHNVQKALHRLAMDDSEDITWFWMDLDEAYQKVKDQTIRDGKTILAIQFAMLQKAGL